MEGECPFEFDAGIAIRPLRREGQQFPQALGGTGGLLKLGAGFRQDDGGVDPGFEGIRGVSDQLLEEPREGQREASSEE